MEFPAKRTHQSRDINSPRPASSNRSNSVPTDVEWHMSPGTPRSFWLFLTVKKGRSMSALPWVRHVSAPTAAASLTLPSGGEDVRRSRWDREQAFRLRLVGRAYLQPRQSPRRLHGP